MGVERVKEVKLQTLKSKFKAIRMTKGELVEYFAMNQTTIVINIHSLGTKVEEISIIKRF